MTERNTSIGRGHRVDEIHTHPEKRSHAWLPWLLAGLLALAAVFGWGLMRRHARTIENERHSALPTYHDTTNPSATREPIRPR